MLFNNYFYCQWVKKLFKGSKVLNKTNHTVEELNNGV